MTHTDDQNQGHTGSAILGIAVAAALAAGIGLLYGTKKGEEIREDMADRAQVIAKKFNKTREELQENVRDIFGQVSEELEEKYLEVQGILMAQADDAKDLTEEKYGEMVDAAVKKYAKGRDWTEDSIEKLAKTLKRDWKQLVDREA